MKNTRGSGFKAVVSGAFLGMLMMTSASPAATYYLKSPAVASNDWNNAANWTLNSDGTGGSPANTAAMASHQFDLFGRTVNTPSSNTTFGSGATLIYNGGQTALRAAASTVTTAVATGGTVILSDSTSGRVLNVTTFNNTSGTTTLRSDGGAAGVVTTFNFTTLTGAGSFALATSATAGTSLNKIIELTVSDATGFTGNITWGDTRQEALQFGNDAIFGGGLIVPATGRITLNRDVTFASVSFDGGTTFLDPGTYSYAQLNTDYGTIFNEGGSGSITVIPEPASLGLATLGMLIVGARRRTRR